MRRECEVEFEASSPTRIRSYEVNFEVRLRVLSDAPKRVWGTRRNFESKGKSEVSKAHQKKWN